MKPLFTVIHATYQRPEKAVATRASWLFRAKHPEEIEYLFAVNFDDPTRTKLAELLLDTPNAQTVVGTFKGSAEAWNTAASIARGEVLIQGQDDVVPPLYWDDQLLKTGVVSEVPTFVAVSDGYRKDKLCCTAIMNRARYVQCGEFLHPGYISVFSDDEVTLRAYGDAAAGKCRMIEAREIVFRHEHAYHNPSVPMDDTYRRENSQIAYAHGHELFHKRNATLLARGLRTWR